MTSGWCRKWVWHRLENLLNDNFSFESVVWCAMNHAAKLGWVRVHYVLKGSDSIMKTKNVGDSCERFCDSVLSPPWRQINTTQGRTQKKTNVITSTYLGFCDFFISKSPPPPPVDSSDAEGKDNNDEADPIDDPAGTFTPAAENIPTAPAVPAPPPTPPNTVAGVPATEPNEYRFLLLLIAHRALRITTESESFRPWLSYFLPLAMLSHWKSLIVCLAAYLDFFFLPFFPARGLTILHLYFHSTAGFALMLLVPRKILPRITTTIVGDSCLISSRQFLFTLLPFSFTCTL